MRHARMGWHLASAVVLLVAFIIVPTAPGSAQTYSTTCPASGYPIYTNPYTSFYGSGYYGTPYYSGYGGYGGYGGLYGGYGGLYGGYGYGLPYANYGYGGYGSLYGGYGGYGGYGSLYGGYGGYGSLYGGYGGYGSLYGGYGAGYSGYYSYPYSGGYPSYYSYPYTYSPYGAAYPYPNYGGTYSVPTPPSSTAAPALTVTSIIGAYTPASATITVGQTVRWTATDVAHTATSDTGLWDSGCIAAGASYAYTFTARGTFTYYCRYHGHRGTITVT